MINHYAQKKQHGFAYKKYPDLLGEIWKDVTANFVCDYWIDEYIDGNMIIVPPVINGY